ncbi:DNA-processing protein DprA [Rubrivirga sp.]|uniref:DNA-processing protein DprA n=1 Tax=Rubrivirga sp. TaxID=1885344 RepID=UPI003B5218B8
MPAPTARFALALLSLDGVGRVTAHRLLERFPSADAVRAAPREQVLLRLKGVAHADRVVDAVGGPSFDDALATAGDRLAALADRQIGVLAPGAAGWPAGLDALDRSDRPVVLYAFGDLGALAWPSLAVLAGAPLAAEPFERAQDVARAVLSRGRGLVVGAAHGVDLALQKLSLAAGVPAVAVVGAGLARLDRSMRPGATALTRSGGLLVSPFPMAHGPFDHDDRERALVQAALGRSVLAVAPPADSPEDRAAAWAAQAGRAVALVPPGPPGAPWVASARPVDDLDAVAESVA